ncbi:MAG: PTS sugar transporter subunit IIA [Erysipelotrichaceae bacterium]|jgi:PTS system fructose-specific IIA component
MTLIDILDKDIIDLEVEGTTKYEVLKNLSKRLLEAGYIKDVDGFISDIYAREAEGPTGMGNHISIPHGKSDNVNKIGIAIGRTKNMIKWETGMSNDGFQDTNLIFLFCVSNNKDFAANHMMLLAELAGKLGNNSRIVQLQYAKTKEEIIDIFINEPTEFYEEDNVEDENFDIEIELL